MRCQRADQISVVFAAVHESVLVLARTGPTRSVRRCPFLGVIRKWHFGAVRTIVDPTRTLSEFHAPRLRRLARECELIEINMVCLFRYVDAVPSIQREVLMRMLALAILVMGMVSAAAPAQAQTYDPDYPVCMHVVGTGLNLEDCRYSTIDQCRASASGRAAQCNINPFYAGATASQGRYDRRHRRVY